jgi:hypothetical protein
VPARVVVPETETVHEQVVVPEQDSLSVRPDAFVVALRALHDPPTHDAGSVKVLVASSVMFIENDPFAPNVTVPEGFVDGDEIMAPGHPGKAGWDPVQFVE